MADKVFYIETELIEEGGDIPVIRQPYPGETKRIWFDVFDWVVMKQHVILYPMEQDEIKLAICSAFQIPEELLR